MMVDYDSDSSGGEDVATNVLLGYASKIPTSDDFSQLGGHPKWLDDTSDPSGALAKCKVCGGYMSLLLQLNGDLPERFPGHERRLYIWACRNRTCQRKEGSVRGVRASRQSKVEQRADTRAGVMKQGDETSPRQHAQAAPNLGEALFGVKSPSSALANPFSNNNKPFSSPANLFAVASSQAVLPPEKPSVSGEANTSLPQTFAQTVRISAAQNENQKPTAPLEPWPAPSAFPSPYPLSHVDADVEYIDSEPTQTPQGIRVDNGSEAGATDVDKTLFESTMDKTFQRFADRLAQNAEQILRYEFAGQPLLYSKADAVGKLLSPTTAENANAKVKVQQSGGSGTSRIPRCGNCGTERVFEMQMTPHAIIELEAEEVSVHGMDWGTILLGVCAEDCQERGKKEGEVGYVEEWIGVQWEEAAEKARSRNRA